MKGLLGKKLGMMRIFNEKGVAIAATLLECGPCPVLQVKTEGKDGYNAVQLGYGRRKEKHATKAQVGHCKKTGNDPVRVLREFSIEKGEEIKAGQVLTVEIFDAVKKVDVIGYSKGRGFTGTIKRHHFQRGRETHGNKNHRSPGSVGGHTYPARTWPGQKGAGRSGDERVTVRNLKVLLLDKERNLMAVEGAIPGPADGMLIVKESIPTKKKGA